MAAQTWGCAVTQILFIRLPELRRMLGGVSTMTIHRWEKKGILPRRVHLGPNVVAWSASEIEEFANRLMSDRAHGVRRRVPDASTTDAAGEGERP
jgi:predicted DNA-binding transcriptional regulator AlpA